MEVSVPSVTGALWSTAAVLARRSDIVRYQCCDGGFSIFAKHELFYGDANKTLHDVVARFGCKMQLQDANVWQSWSFSFIFYFHRLIFNVIFTIDYLKNRELPDYLPLALSFHVLFYVFSYDVSHMTTHRLLRISQDAVFISRKW